MLSFITLPHPRCSPGFLQALLEQPGSFPVCGKWPPRCGLGHLAVSCPIVLSTARKLSGTKAPSCTGWRESASATNISNDGFNTLVHLTPNQKPDLETPVPPQRSWCECQRNNAVPKTQHDKPADTPGENWHTSAVVLTALPGRSLSHSLCHV